MASFQRCPAGDGARTDRPSPAERILIEDPREDLGVFRGRALSTCACSTRVAGLILARDLGSFCFAARPLGGLRRHFSLFSNDETSTQTTPTQHDDQATRILPRPRGVLLRQGAHPRELLRRNRRQDCVPEVLRSLVRRADHRAGGRWAGGGWMKRPAAGVLCRKLAPRSAVRVFSRADRA